MLTWGKTQIINYYKLCQQDDCISNTTECICCRKNDIYCLRHSFKYININGLVYCYYHSGKSICEDCGSSREQNMLMCDECYCFECICMIGKCFFYKLSNRILCNICMNGRQNDYMYE